MLSKIEALYFVWFITQSGQTNTQPLVENIHFYFMKASCMPIKSAKIIMILHFYGLPQCKFQSECSCGYYVYRDNRQRKFQSLKFHDFCQNFQGREGGQHDQHFVKKEFVKIRVGGRGSTSIWTMSLNILYFFLGHPLGESLKCVVSLLTTNSFSLLICDLRPVILVSTIEPDSFSSGVCWSVSFA